jgi:hypothetical protein
MIACGRGRRPRLQLYQGAAVSLVRRRPCEGGQNRPPGEIVERKTKKGKLVYGKSGHGNDNYNVIASPSLVWARHSSGGGGMARAQGISATTLLDPASTLLAKRPANKMSKTARNETLGAAFVTRLQASSYRLLDAANSNIVERFLQRDGMRKNCGAVAGFKRDFRFRR